MEYFSNNKYKKERDKNEEDVEFDKYEKFYLD